jgi:transcriptional regulator with XRE-family HTH domain
MIHTFIMCLIHTFVFYKHMKYASRMPNALDFKAFYRDLGEVIRGRRDVLGMTQADLAARIGLTRASIANIETGRQNLLLHQLIQLAKALELEPEHLLPQVATRSAANREAVLGRDDLSIKQKMQVYRLYETSVPRLSGKPTRDKT